MLYILRSFLFFLLLLLLTRESALTGLEECIVPNDEDHLSADIAISVRQYWRATADKEWLKSVGFPLLQGIADFWVSR